MTNTTPKPWVKAGGYFLLAFACLAGEIWLSIEKMTSDGTQSMALFVIVPVVAVCAAVLIHQTVDDLLSFSVRTFRAPVTGALALAALFVVLPASISSSGSVKDAAVNQASAANTIVNASKDEADRLRAKLLWAEQDRDKLCVKHGKDSRKCLSANDTVNSYQDRRKKALEGVKETPVKTADSGEKRIAWAFSKVGIVINQDDILNGTSMSVPLALAFIGPFFGAAGLSELKRSSLKKEEKNHTSLTHIRNQEANLVLPTHDGSPRTRRRKDRTSQAIEFVRQRTLEGHPPSFQVVKQTFDLPKSTASRARHIGMRKCA